MTDIMKNALAAEISLIDSWIAYEDADELEYMRTLDDAQLQIDGMVECMDPDDPLPESLKDPATMMLVWNYCVDGQIRWAAERREERERPNREYLLKIKLDGEVSFRIATGREIAQIYEEDQMAGIYDELTVYDLRSEPAKISLHEIVDPILADKKWQEQEYRDYCDAVNEYGYDGI